ncbi:leucyl/phenylalanyl-tRNA--protein transferase [Undibacterium crateris]|uniref:leucyl/phenylalanyl-tRNA--protein transferase n=1 Tax=Undibacterium crateris TaxID=2528175 RepID=UPI001389676D|nr:leucyl/phenylalanyl-tRNA--protein transferase [Undibacterium crateris]NDI85874.1 leucyl/phenylalanyl-tRNA--protein transferase [Undibacterium crateris]
MIPWLEQNSPFPDVSTALTEAQGAAGLLAAGADLSAERLLLAYRSGIFPWFSEGQPILWWSTDPRMVLKTADFKLSDSLRKKLNKISHDPAWEIRFDSAFEEVMRACAAPRKDGHGTWISEDIIQGYGELHRKGYAHSSELWLDNTLVGGAYGVCIGKMFYGESMFARVTDASKIALSQLVFFLREQGVQMIDCQQETAHLSSLGARPISRSAFLEWLSIATEQPAITNWQAPEIRSK